MQLQGSLPICIRLQQLTDYAPACDYFRLKFGGEQFLLASYFENNGLKYGVIVGEH